MGDVQADLRTWIAQFATGDHDIAKLLCERHAEDPRRLALRYEDAQPRSASLRSCIRCCTRPASRVRTCWSDTRWVV
jgi:hypothetical protein